jgi:hypothetical protein
MSDGVGVDGPAVAGIGEAVLDAAGRLERLAAGIGAWEYQAQDAVDGAAMCYSTMPYAAGMWQSTLTRLAGEVRAFGGELREAAAGYQQSDRAAAERVGGTY